MDPLELSSFRLHNLALYYLKEGKTEEEVKELEQELKLLDAVKHPLHMLYYRSKPKKSTRSTATRTPSKSASAGGYVPSWWRGDHQNYNVAKTVMKSLPT